MVGFRSVQRPFLGSGGQWVPGRAGMLYRDLVPGRCGGRLIASHIRIPDGGPVPDWVHWHRVRFQMIYCYRGWVRVVYEDQGPPFVLEAGDCVLQPPGIRHRVLESSPGLEVIEVTSPSDHETLADEALELPTEVLRPEREWAGQRFVRHRAALAQWSPFRIPGFEARDIGIADATNGFASVQVVRPAGTPDLTPRTHDAELVLFVLAGCATLRLPDASHDLHPEDTVVVPATLPHALVDPSADFELLEVIA
jgi:quercetin dioxygenase-like cupin family protein